MEIFTKYRHVVVKESIIKQGLGTYCTDGLIKHRVLILQNARVQEHLLVNWTGNRCYFFKKTTHYGIRNNNQAINYSVLPRTVVSDRSCKQVPTETPMQNTFEDMFLWELVETTDTDTDSNHVPTEYKSYTMNTLSLVNLYQWLSHLKASWKSMTCHVILMVLRKVWNSFMHALSLHLSFLTFLTSNRSLYNFLARTSVIRATPVWSFLCYFHYGNASFSQKHKSIHLWIFFVS
jgi:hypothetical protein